MNRQKGVWITILCILVIGVSVTKITSNFVTSGALETIAAENLGDSAENIDTVQALTEMAAVPEGAAGSSGKGTENAAEAGVQSQSVMESVAMDEMQTGAVGADSGTADSEMAGAPRAFAAIPEMAETAAADTVKSPLEPAAGPRYYQAAPESESSAVETGYTAEEYKKRLDQTAAQVVQYRELPNDSSANFTYIASEYEWDLWDNELNTLYGILRSRMTEEEAEALKQEELEWLKERDGAADKAAAKSNTQNSRSTAYLEALAKKTKERCYDLIESYPEVLERAPADTEEVTIKMEDSH